MPEFFIHCGLHKTGTTALQHFLASNAQTLYDAGLHYLPAGTMVGGAHHNLAWELGRDRRYNGSHGNLELMLKQAARGARDAVISSEDFESSLLSPERWAPLVTSLKSLGFSVNFVIYLREPASYLQSLFLENIKPGCGDEFGVVARAILERGSYHYRDWTFCFDYDLVARQMAQVSGAKVVFRSFEHLVGGAIVPDFFSLIGHQVPSDGIESDARLNSQTDGIELLKSFLANRHYAFMPPIEQLVEVAELMVGERKVAVSMPGRLVEAIKRHRASEVKQAVDLQAAVPFSPPRPRSGDWIVNISRLFSWETQVEALAIYDQAPGAGVEKLAALRSGDQGVFENWRNWVAAGL